MEHNPYPDSHEARNDEAIHSDNAGAPYSPPQMYQETQQHYNSSEPNSSAFNTPYATPARELHENMPIPPQVPQHMEQHERYAHQSQEYSQGPAPHLTFDGAGDQRPQGYDNGIPLQQTMDPNDPRYAPQQHARPASGLSGSNDGSKYGNMSAPAQSSTYQDQNSRGSSSAAATEASRNKNSVVIKVGMVGDAQIGKTSLMVKYVEGSWDEDYIQTLGVNFMEKTISIRNTEITFSIWDLGGQREFVNMLPLVCNDAVAILFMFDLTRKSTLNSVKEWYRQGRGFNKTAIPFLVGTKYDHFVNFPREDQEEISNQARRFAKAMKASLIFSSTSHSINVQKVCYSSHYKPSCGY